MTNSPGLSPKLPRPWRIWPGIVLVALQWLFWVIVPRWFPEASLASVLGGLIGSVAVALWWLIFSRAPWQERVGVLLAGIAGLAITSRLVHPSIAGGMMGLLLYIYALPVLSLALVLWAAIGSRWPAPARRFSLVTAILLACAAFTLLRTDGMTGDAASDFHWRWTPTAEERLLERASPEVVPTREIASAQRRKDAEWTGFRGNARDGVVRGVRLGTNWNVSPPTQLWRRAAGPGWSSFAVASGRCFTQEQRGEEEVVACYDLATGQPVWTHGDAARFWESNAGAGPRATPTFHAGRIYTFGATGLLNALDAANGKVLWTRHVAADAQVKVPGWGFAGSPLVMEDRVVVAASGRLAAYDAATGVPRWLGPVGGGGYSSPQWAVLGGVGQILLLNGTGLIGVAPADGAVLWKSDWRGDGIVQPALTADGDVLIGSGSGLGSNARVGVRRLAVQRGTNGWSASERWTSIGLKPYYNDLVVHEGHAYGFDGGMIACVDLADGRRKWKGGRYGHGQLILLADQGLLLVVTEQGDLVLAGATPVELAEVARFAALNGKTWNHPVLAGEVLLVRNSEEIAAFRLPPAAP